MPHLSSRVLADLIAGRLRPVVLRQAVRHLVTGCDRCRSRLLAAAPQDSFPWSSPPLPEDAYDACIDRAREAVRPVEGRWAEERERCQRGVALVQAKGWSKLKPAERRSFRGTWAHVELLLQLSLEARYRDLQAMLDYADSALEVMEQLDSSDYGEAPLCDLRARVWAEVANACRANELFGRSEVAIAQARKQWGQGTESVSLQARIDEIEGSLYKDERNLSEAEKALDRAYRANLKLGERHSSGRVLVTLGMCAFLSGRPLEAVAILRKSVALLDAERDPQLLAVAQYNILFALVDAGSYSEASRLLLRSGLRQTFAGDPMNLLRLRWLEAKILAGRDRLADAGRVFHEVRAGFHERRLELVAAVVGLDEVKILLQQGQPALAHELSQELLQRAQEAGALLPQARHALRCFEVVCRYHVATLDNAERVRRFLEQLEHHPHLRWEAELLFAG